jgi:DHA3 family macrolide efflux protein-like MFS transporter
MSFTEPYQPPPNGFRTFVIVWVTQSISVFGSALTWFAVTVWLTQVLYPKPEQKPQLAFALTAIGLTYAVTLLVTPIAGAWADRHDRKRTMMVVDFLNGCLSLSIMTLMVTGLLQFWSLISILVVFGALSPFHNSAFDTSYAMIVPEKQLPRANGMMQTIWSLSGILSPAIAAAIIALPALARAGTFPSTFNGLLSGLTDGSALAIGVDAATFFIASATLIFLNIPSPRRNLVKQGSTKKTSVWADIKEGALYIKRRPPLLWLLATFTMANFTSAPVEVFVPLLLKFNLAADWQSKGFAFESALAVISTVGGIGGVIGGVAMSTWGGVKRKRIYGVVIPILISGFVEIVYGLSPMLYLTAAANLLFVGLVPFMNAHSQTIWQSQVPRHLQGRVFSVRRVIAQFTAPIGIMMSGIAGAELNPGWILAGLGVLVSAFCVVQLFNPYLLRVEDKAYLDELAIKNGELPENLAEPPSEPIRPVAPLPTPAMEN